MSSYNIRGIKFFLTKVDCVAVYVKPWLRLRTSCPVTLGGGRRNKGHSPDYIKWPKTRYYQKTQRIHCSTAEWEETIMDRLIQNHLKFAYFIWS